MRILFIAITYLLCSTTSKADTYRYTAYGNISGVSATSSSEFIVGDPIEFSFEIDDTQTLQLSNYYGSNGSHLVKVQNITFSLSDNAQGNYNNIDGIIAETDLHFVGPYFDGNNNIYTPDLNPEDNIEALFPTYNGAAYSGELGLGFQQLNDDEINVVNGISISEALNNAFSIDELLKPSSFTVEWDNEYIYGSINTSLQTVINLSNPTDTSTPENPPVGTNTVILKTYKSNDMQNWELIESKEIQSETPLFLKSELVTE